jgi:hypothetical protein
LSGPSLANSMMTILNYDKNCDLCRNSLKYAQIQRILVKTVRKNNQPESDFLTVMNSVCFGFAARSLENGGYWTSEIGGTGFFGQPIKPRMSDSNIFTAKSTCLLFITTKVVITFASHSSDIMKDSNIKIER